MMNIKLFVMDVDGTLTDGKIYMSDKGEIMKAFNIKDGLMIASLKKYGIIPVIITGRTSQITLNRCMELGITEVHQGIQNKIEKLYEIAEKYGCTANEIGYIGDDINDLDCMKICGFTACPSDAVKEVQNSVDFICAAKGGEGAVREALEKIIFAE